MGISLLGIDIGTCYTKVVELEQKVKPSVVNAILFPTPYQTLPDGQKQIEVKSFLSQFANLKLFNRRHNLKIAINISPSCITALSMFLPIMGKKELSFAAISEARRKMIPPSGSNHIFECVPLGERIIDKIPRFEVLVIRTEKIYIQEIINLFKDINIAPALIVPNCCVLPNIIPRDAWNKDEDIIFVDIGASSINISICREGKLVFTRNAVYGFQDIVQDLAHQLSLDPDQTDNLLKELGVPQVPFDFKDKASITEEIVRQKYVESQKPPATDKPLVNPLELRALWQPHLERIVQELRRSLVYYKEQSKGRRIGQIYFLGGGIQIKNLFTALIDQIGGECQIILPFKGMQIPREKVFTDEVASTPIFVNATCLALATPAESMKQMAINFLPLELKKKEIIAARRLVLLSAEICLIFVFTLALLHAFLANHSLNMSMKRVEFELSRVNRVVGRLKDLGRNEEIILSRFSQIEKIIKQRPNFLVPLQELGSIVPQEVLLTKLAISQGKVMIEAQIFASYEQAVKIIEDFQRQLESIRDFNKINVTPLKLEKVSPQVTGADQELHLTQPQPRNFTVTIEVITK